MFRAGEGRLSKAGFQYGHASHRFLGRNHVVFLQAPIDARAATLNILRHIGGHQLKLEVVA